MQLGNDIVDLKIDAEIHPRFLERILHEEEQRRYPDLSARPELVWTLWAAKEAAFKAFRQSEMRFFLPNRWNVDLAKSCVAFEERRWILNIEQTSDSVFATCASEAFATHSEIFSAASELLPKEQAKHSRELLDSILARYAPGAQLHKDAGGVPRLTLNQQTLPFSISHHGRHILVSLALTSAWLNAHPSHS